MQICKLNEMKWNEREWMDWLREKWDDKSDKSTQAPSDNHNWIRVIATASNNI